MHLLSYLIKQYRVGWFLKTLTASASLSFSRPVTSSVRFAAFFNNISGRLFVVLILAQTSFALNKLKIHTAFKYPFNNIRIMQGLTDASAVSSTIIIALTLLDKSSIKYEIYRKNDYVIFPLAPHTQQNLKLWVMSMH